jgi:hypothetical protein
MSRPTTLQPPWLPLAIKLGGPAGLYVLLQTEMGISEATAKRLCRGTGTLTYSQWRIVDAIFRDRKLEP